MSWTAGLDVSPWTLLAIVWVLLQMFNALKKKEPPAPPGGLVKGIHSEAEWTEAHQAAKAAGKLLVADFTATWCPPCRMIAPVYESLSEKYPDVVFLKVDVDQAPGVAAGAKVQRMPTFQFFKGGAQVEEFLGADKTRLEASIVKHSK